MKSKLKTRKTRVVREARSPYKVAPRPSLTSLEAKALRKFRTRLKEILNNGELKSLILYGSKARGERHPGSDIDLLVVYDPVRGGKRNRIRNVAHQIAEEFVEQAVIDIHPLVFTIKQLAEHEAVGMPLLHNVAREGIILEGEPIMPEPMDRKHWSSFHIEEAKETLKEARLLLDNGSIRRPISMAFFIYEHAMRAALAAKGIIPKSHTGTQTLFSLHFVKTAIVPSKFSTHFNRMLEDRNDAEYEMKIPFTPEDAERALARAEELLTVVENIIPSLLGKEPWNYPD